MGAPRVPLGEGLPAKPTLVAFPSADILAMRCPTGASHALRDAALATKGDESRRRNASMPTAMQTHVVAVPIEHRPGPPRLLLEGRRRHEREPATTCEHRRRSPYGQPAQSTPPPAPWSKKYRPSEEVLQEACMRVLAAPLPMPSLNAWLGHLRIEAVGLVPRWKPKAVAPWHVVVG